MLQIAQLMTERNGAGIPACPAPLTFTQSTTYTFGGWEPLSLQLCARRLTYSVLGNPVCQDTEEERWL